MSQYQGLMCCGIRDTYVAVIETRMLQYLRPMRCSVIDSCIAVLEAYVTTHLEE